MNKKTRDSNIELLRIILMFMIILHHLIVHGCKLSLLAQDELPLINNIPLFLFLNCFLVSAVNCYIFISAYYGIKFSLKGLLSFVIQGSFYSVIIYLVASFSGWEMWSFPNFFRSLIPILSGKWWFLSGYILLFILSPIINAGLETLNRKQHLFISIALIIISASYYITNFNIDSQRVNISTIGLFLTIYISGRYFRRYSVNIKKPALGYILSTLLVFVCLFFYYKFISYKMAWNILGYTNPIIIVAAICLFFTFKKFNLSNSFINKISALTFGIYLLHDADPSRRFLVYLAQQYQVTNSGLQLFMIFGGAIIIFIVCACIENLRQVIFNPIINSIMKSSLINKINF